MNRSDFLKRASSNVTGISRVTRQTILSTINIGINTYVEMESKRVKFSLN